jgi:transcriptional regulator GlxA family with amidase domain
MTLSIAIYVYPQVEVLDFAGPFEVFTTASRVFGRRDPGQAAPFQVFTVARTLSPVQARAGLRVLPDHSFADCPPVDVLLVPGGVVDQEVPDVQVIDWVRQTATCAQLTASVCTGAFLLAKAGLLQHRQATTHWEDVADLRTQFPDVQVHEGVRWVDGGAVVTSAGIAAGIDMCLHLVARLAGEPLAMATARQMDVPYVGVPQPAAPAPGPARAGAVIYAQDLERMSAFYQAVLGMRPLHQDATHHVIGSVDMQLVLHVISPPLVAAGAGAAGAKPVPRADQAIKPFFTVSSLAGAESAAGPLGGMVFGDTYAGPGFRMRNACDPEGNILQLRERLPTP